MPLASGSLRERLEGGPLALGPAIDALEQVAEAFVALSGRVVHRDLKPENVLRLADSWAVSDFGIAKYAEASTSADTRKFSFTRPYASPEQWRFERVTTSSDVYSFVVMAF